MPGRASNYGEVAVQTHDTESSALFFERGFPPQFVVTGLRESLALENFARWPELCQNGL